MRIWNLASALLHSLAGGEPQQELSPSPEVPGVAVVKASEELCPHYEVISQNVPHIAYTYHLKAASVRSENVVTSRPEDGYLLDLGPSLQVPEPTALAEVAD